MWQAHAFGLTHRTKVFSCRTGVSPDVFWTLLGWLGLPLAQKLQLLGYRVSGSVTRLEKANLLQQNGWDVYPVSLSEDGIKGPINALLKDAEAVVILIPPGLRRNTGSDHVLKMSHLLEAIVAAGTSAPNRTVSMALRASFCL